jgi:hypothetical protein
LEEKDIAESIILKWVLRSRVERCGGYDSFCSEQWLVWELCEQSDECRKFLD